MSTHFSQRRAWAGALGALGLAAFAPGLHAAPRGAAAGQLAVINKASRQGMFSQRIAKAYAMRALGVDSVLADKILQQSAARLGQQFGELKKISPTPAIAKALVELELAWGIYSRNLSTQPVDDKAARRVYLSGEQALQHAQALADLHEKRLGTPQARLLNAAGHGRVLSQRMASAFYFNQLNPGVDAATDLKRARQEFAQWLPTLRDAPQNTLATQQDLALIGNHWLLFQSALNTGGKDIAAMSETLLEQIDALAGKYEKMG
jgi:hypothetical protein